LNAAALAAPTAPITIVQVRDERRFPFDASPTGKASGSFSFRGSGQGFGATGFPFSGMVVSALPTVAYATYISSAVRCTSTSAMPNASRISRTAVLRTISTSNDSRIRAVSSPIIRS